MCASVDVCSVETETKWVVEAQLFYRSVLIPHSLSCCLTDSQHIVYQLHTLGTGHKD